LQKVELSALDRELEILHVVIVILESLLGVHQFLVCAGKAR